MKTPDVSFPARAFDPKRSVQEFVRGGELAPVRIAGRRTAATTRRPSQVAERQLEEGQASPGS